MYTFGDISSYFDPFKQHSGCYSNILRPFDSWSNDSILSWVIKGARCYSHHFHHIFCHHLGQMGLSDYELYTIPLYSFSLHIIFYVGLLSMNIWGGGSHVVYCVSLLYCLLL